MPLLLVKMCSPSHTRWFFVFASVIDTIDFPSSFTNWCEIDRFSFIDFWRDEKASFTWWWWESFAFGKLQLRNLGRKQGFEKQLEKVWNLLCFDESRQTMFKTFLMLCFENLKTGFIYCYFFYRCNVSFFYYNNFIALSLILLYFLLFICFCYDEVFLDFTCFANHGLYGAIKISLK